MEKYIKILAEIRDMDTNDPKLIAEFNTMSANEIFEMVCNYEGLIHYADTIKGWIEDIYGIDLWYYSK